MNGTRLPYARGLLLAGALSLAGQSTGLAFMLHPTPYTTLAFVALGSVLVLTGMAVFSWASYKELKSRSERICEKRFEPGAVIFRQGDAADCVYVVKSGEVDVLRENAEGTLIALARLGPGEYFGEMALLTDAPRNATVRAATRLDVLCIQDEAFRSLYAGLPTLRKSIEAAKSQRTAPTTTP